VDPVAPRIAVAEVRAAHGVAWIAAGFAIFRRQPIAWLGLAIGWLVISIALAFIPFIGIVVTACLQPVFFASFALAARRQLAGETLEVGDLFAGFRGNVRALVNVGLLQLMANLGVASLLALLGLSFAGSSPDAIPTPEDYARVLEGKEWVLILGLGLMSTVSGAIWFAPPLIAFHGLSTLHALRWSVYAALSNIGAMLAYGLTLTLLCVVAMWPLGLGMPIWLPVMIASTYAGYRDVFERTQDRK